MAGSAGAELERGGVQSVRRALALLRDFSRERDELGVNELARAHELHPSTVSRLLATLADAGFVRLNPATHRYRLGFAALELAGLVLLGLDIREAAQPVMRELALRGGETANLAVLDGREAVIVEQAPSSQPCRVVSWVGRRVPLHATAHGRVLLAFGRPQAREALLAALADPAGVLPPWSEKAPHTLGELRAILATVAAQGYATAFSELDPEVAGVAAPVYDHEGTVVASLSLSGPAYRYATAHVAALAALVLEGTRRISAELGWRGEPTQAGLGPTPWLDEC